MSAEDGVLAKADGIGVVSQYAVSWSCVPSKILNSGSAGVFIVRIERE